MITIEQVPALIEMYKPQSLLRNTARQHCKFFGKSFRIIKKTYKHKFGDDEKHR